MIDLTKENFEEEVLKARGYVLVDLPGTYSLMAHSAEEEVARDFLLLSAARTGRWWCATPPAWSAT